MTPRDRVLPLAARRQLFGQLYRVLLAPESEATEGRINGTAPVDETGAAAGGLGGGQRDDGTRRNLPT